MAKEKDGENGGRKDPQNFNMMGNPNRKATEAKEIVSEGKNPGIENSLKDSERFKKGDETFVEMAQRRDAKQKVSISETVQERKNNPGITNDQQIDKVKQDFQKNIDKETEKDK